ncbi:MAG: hypothetical protein RJB01_151, partial [Actinomycetota bacterium]
GGAEIANDLNDVIAGLAIQGDGAPLAGLYTRTFMGCNRWSHGQIVEQARNFVNGVDKVVTHT